MKPPDDRKFKELILFIAERSEGDRPFGATKLNKLLFLADFCAFLSLGEAITWHRYQRLPQGPAPKALLPILEQMKAAGDIEFSSRDYHGKKQKRVVALREADSSVFSGPEIAIVTDIIEENWGRSATRMSELSHDFIGWQLAKPNEEIPYHVALLNLRKATDQELAEGLEFESLARECLGDTQRP